VDFEEHQALKKYYDAVETLPDLENVAHRGKEFFMKAPQTFLSSPCQGVVETALSRLSRKQQGQSYGLDYTPIADLIHEVVVPALSQGQMIESHVQLAGRA